MHWRLATSVDDAAIVALSTALYQEDPSPEPVPPTYTTRTLQALRQQPVRGQAMVLDAGAQVQGYAFLMAFWSNEMGGEAILLDELFVAPAARGHGYGAALLQQLQRSPSPLWPRPFVAVDLEVTPGNARARALYARMGFAAYKNASMRLRLSRAARSQDP